MTVASRLAWIRAQIVMNSATAAVETILFKVVRPGASLILKMPVANPSGRKTTVTYVK